MHTFLDDPIEVLASFERKQVRPLRMKWQEKSTTLSKSISFTPAAKAPNVCFTFRFPMTPTPLN